MANKGWKCKKCNTLNNPEEVICNNCGAKKSSFFTSPLFYIALGVGILLIIVMVIVSKMINMPEEKYKEAVEKVYKDKQVTEDEKKYLAKIQKQWNVSDEKAETWKNEILKKIMPPIKPATTPETVSQSKDKETVPIEAKLNLQQGLNYVKLKDFDNAIKEFTLAIEKNPNYATAYANRAVAYTQQRKFNKAMDDLKKASEIAPGDPMVYYNFTALYSLQNQMDRSLDSLDRALELGFNDYDSLRKDPDLNNVRKHPEFRKILEKYKVFLK